MADAAPVAAPAAPVSPAPAAPSSAPAPVSTPVAPADPKAAPVAAEPPKPAAPAPLRTFKRTINGQAVEIPAEHVEALAKVYGMEPQDLLRGPDLMRAAYAKHEEVAKARKEFERAQAEAKKRFEDPRITQIKAENPDFSDEDAWALLRTRELYERTQQTPEQRALAEERKKREALEARLKSEEEGKRAAQSEAETKAAVERFQREVPEAAAKYNLPRSPTWGRAMLDHMASMARQGRPIDAMEAAAFVKTQVQATDRARFTEMEPAAVVEWLGQDVVKRILTHEVQRVKGGGAAPAPTPANPAPPSPKPAGAVLLSPEEWRKKFG